MLSGRQASIQKRDERTEAEDLTRALPPLLLRAEQLVRGFDAGVHGRRKAGTGEDFWQFKQYAEGDTANSIDWRQSAKRDNLFIRQKELETAENIWFWQDTSPTMDYKSHLADHTKQTEARVLALATALLLAQGGENFALLGARDKTSHGPLAFDHFSRDLFTNTSENLTSLPTHTGLPSRSRLILISDFLGPLPEIERTLAAFSRSGCQGMLIHMADPAEVDFPFTGRTQFEAVGDDTSLTIGRTESIRDEYKELFAFHKSSLQKFAKNISWDYCFYRTDKQAGETLAAVYQALSGRD